jgi:hypothetical protein
MTKDKIETAEEHVACDAYCNVTFVLFQASGEAYIHLAHQHKLK